MSGRADTPTPEFVGNSRVRGALSPPGTPRDLTTPSRAHLGPAAGKPTSPVDFARAKRETPSGPVGLLQSKAEKRRPPGLHQSKVEKSCARVDFSRAKRRSVPPAGLSQSKVGKCARRALLHGKAQKRFSGRRRQKTARPAKKNRVFFRPLRACIRKRGLLFRKKNR